MNQWFWLEYHKKGDLVSPSLGTDTHLIRPSEMSEQLAQHHHLVPFRQWINLTHESNYIHGPFDFATVNGKKTRDRVSTDDWNVLHAHHNMFNNDPPNLELPTYSVHVDQGVRTVFGDERVAKTLILIAEENSKNGERVI